MANKNLESLIDMFIFETSQLLEQLEQIMIDSEKSDHFSQETVNEIFRIMHTIKGSSAMMNYNNISSLAHSVEDLFYIIREKNIDHMNSSELCDIILESIDFIKSEIKKIEKGKNPDKSASPLLEKIRGFSDTLAAAGYGMNEAQKCSPEPEIKPSGDDCSHRDKVSNSGRCFKATLFFEEGCEMENIRALLVTNNLKAIANNISFFPADIADNNNSAETIRKEGFQIWFQSDCTFEEIHQLFSQTIFLKDLELNESAENEKAGKNEKAKTSLSGDAVQDNVLQPSGHGGEKTDDRDRGVASPRQNMISVNVSKLDKLMDLVGELVISASMVEQNPDLSGLTLENFQKAARNHNKIIHELQDIAMSIRMVPLSATMQKMNRIVRDMSKKLSRDVALDIIGEETEVDKNIIEHISDPLMHLIRNSIDHGIEPADERKAKGKPETGTITLEAKNAGGDVLIIVKDDGRGLDRQKILSKAIAAGIVNRPESEITDKEIYSYIFQPGFSTNEKVTEFSGRGVGMDVVTKNIGAVGGTVGINSVPGKGTAITLKIPLTLAIMGGMIIRVGESTYTIPMISIRESFKVQKGGVITDPDGNEMLLIRGECCPVLRLHELYKVKKAITDIPGGIIVMVENNGRKLCIFADELIGEQQVVVKALPEYIRRITKAKGVAGCTLLGNGSISLIIDIADLMDAR